MGKKLTTEIFLERVIKRHGVNRYSYPDFVYKNSHSTITIVCNICNLIFNQKAYCHFVNGCPNCYGTKLKTNDEFKFDAFKIHGENRYSYPEEYKGTDTPIKIVCNICLLEFFQTPYSHLKGHGCHNCCGFQELKSHANFVKQGNLKHNNKYEYPEEYINSCIKITIKCPIHGDFKQTPDSHLRGRGCKKCADNTIKSYDEFLDEIKIIHGSKYKYFNDYIGTNKKIKIECPKHGIFFQAPKSHLKGHGCAICAQLESKPERKWLDTLSISNDVNHRQVKIKIDEKRRAFRVDGFDPKTNTIYEFYGDYWHGNPMKFPAERFNFGAHKTYGELYQKTLEREKLLRQTGYNIISIWESEWKEQQKLLKTTINGTNFHQK